MGFTLTPAYGKDFIDREDLIADMVTTLADRKNRIGFALYGRRRVGKTSILMEVCRLLESKKRIVPVYFSLWELVEETMEEFIKTLSATIVDSYHKKLPFSYKFKSLIKAPLGLLKEIVRKTRISLKLQDEIEVLLTFSQKDKESISLLIDKVFNLAEDLAAETKTKCILIIDEFPSILELKNGGKIGEGVIRKIRTLMEKKENTVLCISGSIRKTMKATALKPSSPFYRQFVVKNILPLEEKYVRELLKKNLNIPISKKAVDKIYEFSRGLPFYVQFLGRELLRYRGKKITEEIIPKVIDEFLTQEGNLLFSEEFEDLSPKERLLLLCMAKRDTSSPSQISKDAGEDLGVVSMYLRYLEDKQIIRRESRGIYSFEDPIFQEWLRKKFAT